MDDDVLGADRGKAVAAEVADALGEARVVRRELEIGAVIDDESLHVADVHHVVEIEDVHRVGGELELVEQEVAQLRGHRCVDGDRDQVAAAAPLQRALVEQDQILGLLVDLDVAVADQAEEAAGTHLVAGEQARQEDVDEFFQRQEADRRARQAHETIDLRRQGQQRHQRALVLLALQLQHRREAAVRDERERMRRIDGQRRQDREDLVDEILLEPGTFGGRELGGGQHGDAGLAQLALQGRPDALLLVHQDRGAVADRGQLLRRRQPVVAQQRRAIRQHVDEPRHTDHVEFVEVGRRNRQEAHPLEQRMARVRRFFQHARVEREPRKLTIDETAWTVGRYGCSLFSRCRCAERIHKSYSQTVPSLHDGVMAIN